MTHKSVQLRVNVSTREDHSLLSTDRCLWHTPLNRDDQDFDAGLLVHRRHLFNGPVRTDPHAKPSDPAQIFYATLSPSVVSNGAQVHVAVVTTSNASTVKLQVGNSIIGLSQTAPGQWQGAFPFPGGAVPVGQSTLTLSLSASRADGTSATIPVPVSISGP